MARPVASCAPDAQCRSREAVSAQGGTVRKWAGVPDIPSWEAVLQAIRGQAEVHDAEAAQDLNDWADFVEGCAELRCRGSIYQKKS